MNNKLIEQLSDIFDYAIQNYKSDREQLKEKLWETEQGIEIWHRYEYDYLSAIEHLAETIKRLEG